MKQPIILTVLAFFLALAAAGSACGAEQMALERKMEADALLCAGNAQKAAECYESALAQDGRLANAWFNLAIARYQQRDMQGAKEALEALLDLAPQDAEARYNLACMLMYEGDLQTASRQFQKARDCACSSPALLGCIDKAVEFLKNLNHHVPNGKEGIWLGMIQDGLEPV